MNIDNRYERQTALPEIGPEGQARLARARVLIVGVGGLGCPIALYLAAAGVGTLVLVDDDTVGSTNLQRQVLYAETDLGKPKVLCAAQRLRQLNGQIRIEINPCIQAPSSKFSAYIHLFNEFNFQGIAFFYHFQVGK